MEEFTEMMAGAGVIVYVVIFLFVILFVWGGFRLFAGKRKPKVNTDLPTEAKPEHMEESEPKEEKELGSGDIKCLCFRKIKGMHVADFTTIRKPIGELYQFDPSCPVSGAGYIVKENEKGEVVDYDPREIEFKLAESPEYAYFATNWDIVKQVFFVPVQWWKSTSVWFAAAMLVIIFVISLAVLG